jgi:hypothetical protein
MKNIFSISGELGDSKFIPEDKLQSLKVLFLIIIFWLVAEIIG